MLLRLRRTDPALTHVLIRGRRPLLGESRNRVAALLGAVAVLAGGLTPADAYNFLPLWTLSEDYVEIAERSGPADFQWVVRSAEAARWDVDDFPLRVHLQDNIPDFLDESQWRDMVRRAVAQWSAIGTSEASLVLEPGWVAPATEGDGTDAGDGRFTIGWPGEPDVAALGYATPMVMSLETRRLSGCDIVMVEDRFRELFGDPRQEGLEAEVFATVLHEMGHCLGLAHTEPHPVWLRRESFGLPIAAGFKPDTVMSYASPSSPELSEDDVVAISLLYPASGFVESRGAVSGVLTRDFESVPYAYVQAVYPGSRPHMGPGAFADSSGYFHLEGVRPGPLLLWIHPILVQDAVAHAAMMSLAMGADALDILDQWQWVRVERGKTVGVPALHLTAGRSP